MILSCQRTIVNTRRMVSPDGDPTDRQNESVPKRIPLAVDSPMSVYEATQLFGSELRVHLVHYFGANPGTRQVDAVRALGAERAVVSVNTKALLAIGVLERHQDRTYTVNRSRYEELLQALRDFGPPPA